MLARLKMGLNAATVALPRVLYAAGAPLVLLLGFGLTGVTTWLLLTTSIGLLAVAIVSARLLPRSMKPRFDPSLMRQLLRFGVGWLFVVMAVMLLVNLEKLLPVR